MPQALEAEPFAGDGAGFEGFEPNGALLFAGIETQGEDGTLEPNEELGLQVTRIFEPFDAGEFGKAFPMIGEQLERGALGAGQVDPKPDPAGGHPAADDELRIETGRSPFARGRFEMLHREQVLGRAATRLQQISQIANGRGDLPDRRAQQGIDEGLGRFEALAMNELVVGQFAVGRLQLQQTALEPTFEIRELLDLFPQIPRPGPRAVRRPWSLSEARTGPGDSGTSL